MKRVWLRMLILLIFLLCGCTAEQNMPTEPPAEPVLTVQPWDSEGVLSELVLQIPGGSAYTECVGFRGWILLWSTDGHREGQQVLEFCLIDPVQKTIRATREVVMPNPVTPQIYGDSLYLCDSKSGTVLELDRNLEITGEWTVPAASDPEAVWYAANRKLWEFAYDKPLRCLFLGDIYWSEDAKSEWTEVRRPYGKVVQHRLGSGIVNFSFREGDSERFYVLDLTEGTVITPPQGYTHYYRSGNVWLGSRFDRGYHYGICVANGSMRKVSPTDGTLTLLPEGYILEKSPSDQYLRLYDREGRCISVCRLWETLDGYAESLIWNDAMGGYLIHYRSQSGGSRLLFWDIRKGSGIGENLKLRGIPAEEQLQDALRAEAEALGERYGIRIVVGTDCDLEQIGWYSDGTCSYATDYDLVCNAMDKMERGLSRYPEGFFRQMTAEFTPVIRFVLVSGLKRPDTNLSGIAMVLEDAAVLGFDAESMDEDLLYHETAHLIDAYLQWSGSAYSVEEWNGMNPDWFAGYALSGVQLPAHNGHFVSHYATTSPAEDFAQVMEFAMTPKGERYFMDMAGLQAKLSYLSRCIRETFDTSGWDQPPLWEQYLLPNAADPGE